MITLPLRFECPVCKAVNDSSEGRFQPKFISLHGHLDIYIITMAVCWSCGVLLDPATVKQV